MEKVCLKFKFFAVPGEPTNLQARVINSSTVQVSWDPPVDKDQNGIIRGYQIHVQPKNVVSMNIMKKKLTAYKKSRLGIDRGI